MASEGNILAVVSPDSTEFTLLVYEDFTLQQTVVIPVSSIPANELCVASVAIGNGTILVGVPQESRGKVYFFKILNGLWTLYRSFSGNMPNTKFGYTVSIDGDFLCIGSELQTEVYRFENDDWEGFQSIPIGSVSVSVDSNRIVSLEVRADNYVYEPGTVREYSLVGSEFVETAVIPSGTSGVVFGATGVVVGSISFGLGNIQLHEGSWICSCRLNKVFVSSSTSVKNSRVLINNQVNLSLNGIYDTSDKEWTYAPDYVYGENAQGIIVFSNSSKSLFYCAESSIVGVDPVVLEQFDSVSVGGSQNSVQYVKDGVITGSPYLKYSPSDGVLNLGGNNKLSVVSVPYMGFESQNLVISTGDYKTGYSSVQSGGIVISGSSLSTVSENGSIEYRTGNTTALSADSSADSSSSILFKSAVSIVQFESILFNEVAFKGNVLITNKGSESSKQGTIENVSVSLGPGLSQNLVFTNAHIGSNLIFLSASTVGLLHVQIMSKTEGSAVIGILNFGSSPISESIDISFVIF
jgi:hypothetical protein